MSVSLSFVAFYRKPHGQTAANKCCSYQGLIYDSVSPTKKHSLLCWNVMANKMTLADGDIFRGYVTPGKAAPDLRRFARFQQRLCELKRGCETWDEVAWRVKESFFKHLDCWYDGSFGGGWRRGDGRWGDFQVFTALHFDSFFVFVLHVLWFPFCFCNALHFDFLFVFVLHVAARRGSRCRQPWHWGRRPLLLQWAWYCPPLILIIDDKDNKQWNG